MATQLTEKPDSIRMATLRSVMGQNCLQIYQHLHISDADKANVKPSLDALEKYFQPSTNVVYERYVFSSANQGENETAEQYIARLQHLRQRQIGSWYQRHTCACQNVSRPRTDISQSHEYVQGRRTSQLKQIATTAEDSVHYTKKDRQIGKAHKENQSKCK